MGLEHLVQLVGMAVLGVVICEELLLRLKPTVDVFVIFQDEVFVHALGESLEKTSQLFPGVLSAYAQLQTCTWAVNRLPQRPRKTHISLVFEESSEVVVLPKGWMSRQPLEEHLMHCNRLLEKCQIFSECGKKKLNDKKLKIFFGSRDQRPIGCHIDGRTRLIVLTLLILVSSLCTPPLSSCLLLFNKSINYFKLNFRQTLNLSPSLSLASF